MCALRRMFFHPLSLALSRKGRGDTWIRNGCNGIACSYDLTGSYPCSRLERPLSPCGRGTGRGGYKPVSVSNTATQNCCGRVILRLGSSGNQVGGWVVCFCSLWPDPAATAVDGRRFSERPAAPCTIVCELPPSAFNCGLHSVHCLISTPLSDRLQAAPPLAPA